MKRKPGLPVVGRLDAASLESLVGLAYDAILVRWPDSRIVFWNAGAEALYGWSQDEALGRRSHELLATGFPVPLEEIERELVVAGSWEGRLVHRTKAGGEVVVESRWAPHFGADGELVAVMEVNRDITARAAAERELAAEAARFRAIFDASLDAILLTAPDGRIFAANAAAQAMLGRSEEEIVTGGRELLLDRSDPRVAAGLQERDATGRFRGDVRALRRDGTPFEVETSSVVFTDASGEERTSTVIHDVTERLQVLESARESEARFRALSDAAFEAVFIHDAGRILDVNRAAGALYGYTEHELKTMHVLDLVPPRQAEHAQALLEAPPEGPFEIPALTADGAELLVEMSGRAITFHGRPARVVAVRDITERERVRQTLEEQNQRLRELDALKSEFVALVSHELRTPLTSIIALSTCSMRAKQEALTSTSAAISKLRAETRGVSGASSTISFTLPARMPASSRSNSHPSSSRRSPKKSSRSCPRQRQLAGSSSRPWSPPHPSSQETANESCSCSGTWSGTRSPPRLREGR